MSGTGTDLRDLLQAAVGVPPRHVDLAAVRRRVRRRRWAESGGAVMAVALVAVLGATVFAGASGPAPLRAAAVHAGQPAYYIQQGSSLKPPTVLRVRATASGKVTDTVRCPGRGVTVTPGALAAAGSGVFLMVCQKAKEGRLYRFHLTATGRVAGYSPVKGGTLGQFSAYDLAVARGGQEAAVALSPVQGHPNSTYGVLVINTETGARALWRMGTSPSGMVLSNVGSLTLTSNGRELAFTADVRCPHRRAGGGCTAGQEVRAVSPANAGGRLVDSRVVFRSSELRGLSSGYVNDALLTPDGLALDVAVIHSGGRGGTVISVVQVSARTGRQLRVLYRVKTGNGMSYQYFSADATGRYLMLDAGTSSQAHNGWIYHGRLVPMTPYDGDDVRWQIW